MVDYFKGVHATGMERVFVEAEQRRIEHGERISASGPMQAVVPMTFEEFIATAAFFGLFLGIWYYGVNVLLVDWYWPAGIGLATGAAMRKLLLGPLFFVLILAKWLTYISVAGALIYVFFAR